MNQVVYPLHKYNVHVSRGYIAVSDDRYIIGVSRFVASNALTPCRAGIKCCTLDVYFQAMILIKSMLNTALQTKHRWDFMCTFASYRQMFCSWPRHPYHNITFLYLHVEVPSHFYIRLCEAITRHLLRTITSLLHPNLTYLINFSFIMAFEWFVVFISLLQK